MYYIRAFQEFTNAGYNFNIIGALQFKKITHWIMQKYHEYKLQLNKGFLIENDKYSLYSKTCLYTFVKEDAIQHAYISNSLFFSYNKTIYEIT